MGKRANSVDKNASDFQFLMSRVENIAFENKVLHIEEDCQRIIDLDYFDIDSIERNEDIIGNITLKVTVEIEQKEQKVVLLEYTITGFFKANNCEKDVFEQMLKINGLATLYSFARAHITTISSLAGIQPITIPMINVYKYVSQKEGKKA